MAQESHFSKTMFAGLTIGKSRFGNPASPSSKNIWFSGGRGFGEKKIEPFFTLATKPVQKRSVPFNRVKSSFAMPSSSIFFGPTDSGSSSAVVSGSSAIDLSSSSAAVHFAPQRCTFVSEARLQDLISQVKDMLHSGKPSADDDDEEEEAPTSVPTKEEERSKPKRVYTREYLLWWISFNL